MELRRGEGLPLASGGELVGEQGKLPMFDLRQEPESEVVGRVVGVHGLGRQDGESAGMIVARAYDGVRAGAERGRGPCRARWRVHPLCIDCK